MLQIQQKKKAKTEMLVSNKKNKKKFTKKSR